MSGAVDISVAEPTSPALRKMLSDLDEYLKGLYDAGPQHFVCVENLTRSGVTFFLAKIDNSPVGCVALGVLNERDVELKRLYVAPEARGAGAGKALIAAFEKNAIARGAGRIVLETGPQQNGAIALFESCGFSACGPYPETTWGKGLFFEKRLTGGNGN